MKHFFSLFLVGTALLFMVACKQVPAGKSGMTDADSSVLMPLEYAKGFTVKTLENGVKLVDVADPQQDEDKGWKKSSPGQKSQGKKSSFRIRRVEESFEVPIRNSFYLW